MNQQRSYRLTARTEPAGKYDPQAPNEGNEDSFGIIADIGNSECQAQFDTQLPLPKKGVLLVVADGMGGHSAGEVASQLAVATVRDCFADKQLQRIDTTSPKARAKFMEQVVVKADKCIRAEADANPERRGMGSTIVMAWVAGNECTVTWCGDSRCYLYNTAKGLSMLSEDHSMVQDMVRRGQLTYEETFSHPQGNIITHCLGGGGKGNAEPESRQFTLQHGDQLLLCSDGLSGVLFDDGRCRPNGDPYSDGNIQDILSQSHPTLQETVNQLFEAASNNDWYDNVTAILFEYLDPEGVADTPAPTGDGVHLDSVATEPDSKSTEENKKQHHRLGKAARIILLVLSAMALLAIGICVGREIEGLCTASDSTAIADTSIPDTIHPNQQANVPETTAAPQSEGKSSQTSEAKQPAQPADSKLSQGDTNDLTETSTPENT